MAGYLTDGTSTSLLPTTTLTTGTVLRYDTWIGSPDAQGNGIPDSCEGHSPIIVSSPLTAAVVGSAYAYDVDATDPDAADTLTYSLTLVPTGMTINGVTGVIEWDTLPRAGRCPERDGARHRPRRSYR